MVNDIVLVGGTVIDGSGAPGRAADVAVRDGRIAAVAEPGALEAAERIDVTGLVVAPGFIDIHSHADFTLSLSPTAESQLAQGVTTLIGGNCGQSPFPVTDRNRVPSGLAGSGDLELAWDDLDGFAAAVEASRPAINLGLQVGHNAIRSAILGDEDRAPSPDELDRMCAEVTAAARAGAFGFSTGLIYPPGLFAATDEVVTLVRTAAEAGLTYSTHVRNETDHVIAAVDEALDAATRAGARLQVSHLKSMGPGNVGKSRIALDHLHAARAEGLDVACDVYPYTASSTSLASRLPAWALDGGREDVARRLADPATQARIVADLTARFGQDIDPAGIVLAELGPGPFADRAGQSIVDIAHDIGRSPAEVVLLVLAGHGDVAIVNHAIDADDLLHILRDPHCAIASDGWVMDLTGPGVPHPRSFGTFARVLGHYVREIGALTLPEAVRKMTSLPAERLGLTDRGLVRAGLAADLTVFDPATIADRATYEQPRQAAVGVRAVLVNGVPVVRDGVATGARGGRVLRKGR
ncbi:D-aminoacylase [Cellulomonas sp. NPDC089187]|uniref:N-acyl-D-amino-acid deacylase family protein n=1 Tax=Cellulomonas sp. NPDC089187 TaxID=3154970 RepID=UPI00343161B6